MTRILRQSTGFMVLSLMLAIGLGLSSCQRRSEAESSRGARASTEAMGQSSDAATADPAAASGYHSTPINPPRMAYLETQQDSAQINLRSQPTTESDSLGYGAAGDQVQLLRLAEGEGGYSWYLLKLTDSSEEGWIRGDFINTTRQAAATAAAAAKEPEKPASSACGRDRQEAHYETASFAVYICNLGDRLRYVGIQKDSQESLVTEDVRNLQGTYVAINQNYQYHVNEQSLAVYRVNQGAYNQLVEEKVLSYEQFLY